MRLLRVLLAGSLLLVAVLAFAYALERTRRVWAAALVVILGGITWIAAERSHRRGRPARWALAVVTLLLVVVVPELALRLTEFRYESGIAFGFPRRAEFRRFVPDERLFWRLAQEPEHDTRETGDAVVLFLGDSVTYQGYPDQVEGLLATKLGPSTRVRCLSLAVPGYSSHQGVLLAEEKGRAIAPRVVVVLFGWNDHWLAYGAVDADREPAAPSRGPARVVESVRRRLRLLQALDWAAHLGRAPEPLGEVRVPADRYRQNLEEILRVFRSQGVPVVFLTAPSTHRRLGVPRYLVERGFARDEAAVLSLHEDYNEIVRETARLRDATLLDLAADFDRLSSSELEALFLTDGIHLSTRGAAVVSHLVANAVEDLLRDDGPP
jgi:lysophospholipase L1-like esterase